MTKLTQGNKALRDKDYQQAIACYIEVLMANPEISKAIVPNITMAQQKFTVSRKETKGKQRVAVCGWALSHHAERICTLAILYEAFAEVEIIGALFPTSGTQVSESIRDIAIPIHSFVVDDEGLFLEQALKLVLEHPFDVVHLSQPKMPNIFFGILYKLIWNAKVLVDIDDEEIATEPAISLDAYISEKGSLPELKALEGVDWTRLALGLVDDFDGITTKKIFTFSLKLLLNEEHAQTSQRFFLLLTSYSLLHGLNNLLLAEIREKITTYGDISSSTYLPKLKSEDNMIEIYSNHDLQMDLIIKSGLYNEDWYLSKNIDQKKEDVLLHFCIFGYKEGRNINPFFDTSWYINQYMNDIDFNPIVHYIIYGWKKNYNPSPLFDITKYLSSYSKVNCEPLSHYFSSIP